MLYHGVLNAERLAAGEAGHDRVAVADQRNGVQYVFLFVFVNFLPSQIQHLTWYLLSITGEIIKINTENKNILCLIMNKL